jgi:2-methylcitrate dehydratase PrpD
MKIMSDYLNTISEFAAGLRYEDLPVEVVRRAKNVMADSMAVIASGAQEQEIAAMAKEIDPPAGPAVLLGLGRKADSLNAALINGTAGTFLELDEGNQFARGHPAIHVVPAILALGEERSFSGRDLIAALVVGYEIGARIGIASKIRMSMHPHGTWGTVGATAAAGRLDGVDAAAMKEMINISSSLGLTTSRQTMLQGGTVRNTFSGVSNYMGLLTLKLFKAGFTGERDGLSTVYGSVISEVFEPDAMTEDLGTRFEIARNYFKRHACCRYNHSALDALMDIASRFEGGRIPADQVAKVKVETYSLAAQLCDPKPANMLAAKFSIPFAVGTYLVHGDTGVPSFRAEKTGNEDIHRLAGLTTVLEDQDLTAMMPSRRPSRVTVTLTDGTTHSAETFLNKGDFEDPYSEDEIRAKYYELAEPIWGRSVAEALHQDLMRLEEIENVRDMTARLS